MRVVSGDSISNLESIDPVDVVYLDPMFTNPGRSSALPRKRAQLLRRIVEPDSDGESLFHAAMGVAGKRVVVKRAVGDEPLVPGPNLHVSGKIARYDVYLPDRRA